MMSETDVAVFVDGNAVSGVRMSTPRV